MFFMAWGNSPEMGRVPPGFLSPVFKDQGEDKIRVEQFWVDKTPVTIVDFFNFVENLLYGWLDSNDLNYSYPKIKEYVLPFYLMVKINFKNRNGRNNIQ